MRTNILRNQRLRTKPLRAIGALLLASTALTLARPAHAQDATWSGGSSNFWQDDFNWAPNIIPSGTATFDATGMTSVSSEGLVNIGAVTFTPGSQTYNFSINDFFIVTGAGVTNNNTGATQTFNAASTLQFSNSSSASAGPGAVTYNNSSAIIFNNSSTAGSATITNNGDVEFFSTSNGGTATITNNATVNFGDSSSAGSAHITNNIDSFVAFSANATAGNATITNNNSLTFSNSSSAGSATITNASFGTLDFFHTSTAGNANITNNSEVAFHDSSSAGSAHIFNNNAATLDFQNTSTAGSAIIQNAAGGTLRFSNTSNAGSAQITNTGVLSFFDSGTASASTIINNASLFFNGLSSGGSSFITNTNSISFLDTSTAGSTQLFNNGVVAFFNSSTAGSSLISNQATLNFFLTSTAGSATIRNDGIVNFSGHSTADNATITNDLGGRVNFSFNSTGGNARFINNATGIVDFSNYFALPGDSKLSAGSIEGAGTFYLGPAQLTVGSNNLSTTVSGIIDDCGVGGAFCNNTATSGGSLVKIGSGTLTLSGNNAYTGTTTVNAGTLQVDGSIETSSGVTVNSGGVLAGSGFVSATTINDGGAILPGSLGAPGTLTVQGSLVLASAAMYVVQVTPSTASHIAVNGAATIGGSVLATFAAGSYAAGATYSILNATSVNGTFTGLNTLGLAPSLRAQLSYGTNDVFLTLAYATISPSLLPGANANQRAVANAVDAAIAGGGTPVGGVNTLLGLQGNALGTALTQASGETATGAQQTTFNAMNLFMGALTDPFSAGRGGATAPSASPFADESASAYASTKKPSAARDALAMYTKAPLTQVYEPRWSVWASGFGGTQTTDGNTTAGSNTATSRIFGTAVGFDYRFSPNTIAGVALAGGGTNFSVANGGTGRSDLFQAGAFVRHAAGPTYITAALAYGWQDVTTNRTVTIAGTDRLQARFNANTFAGRVEGGYRVVMPWLGGLGLTPYAAGQFTAVDLPAYAESVISGSNAFALSYGSKSVTNTRSELGLRADKSFALTDAILTLRGRAAWAHDFDTGRSIAATFQTLPGASFVVNGAAMARDAALTTASAELKWLNGFSVAATFEGEFSDVSRSYAGKGTVRYAW